MLKSFALYREWYSRQTSHRPSKLPSAWSFAEFGNRLIGVMRLVRTSTRATPENDGDQISAKNVRPSPAGAIGVTDTRRERRTTERASLVRQIAFD